MTFSAHTRQEPTQQEPIREPTRGEQARAVSRPTRGTQDGPPLPIPVLAYGALMLASVILLAHLPWPTASAASVLGYDRDHQTLLRVGGFLIFGAALPLAIFTATVYRRLRSLGVTAPGAVIALSGGLLAATSIALSGLITWTSGHLGPAADPSVARALGDLTFACGGPGLVVPFALLLAGIAVPGLIIGLLPRWFAWLGLVLAAISVIATFTLLTSALDFTLPIGRFGGLIWVLAASVLLPARRRPANRNGSAAAAAGAIAAAR